MINKKEMIVLALGAVLTFSMIVTYDLFFTNDKTIAIVDVAAITNEFMKLSTKSKLPEKQMDELASAFSEALAQGILEMSNENILLAKRAVVSDEQDKTGELREYVANRITKRKSN